MHSIEGRLRNVRSLPAVMLIIKVSIIGVLSKDSVLKRLHSHTNARATTLRPALQQQQRSEYKRRFSNCNRIRSSCCRHCGREESPQLFHLSSLYCKLITSLLGAELGLRGTYSICNLPGRIVWTALVSARHRGSRRPIPQIPATSDILQ